ncbi:hypothetical protein HERIO_2536 [Hepatospora eriocheir]|uniref:Uncharacterized protein n=1 Tax=Hepatospora eriocheir TaxID=1081669 RepID=A0A1X0Q6J7_9MICR|nr:hypothetical protein HERIO_2536 [Hepatospora eriocheir]
MPEQVTSIEEEIKDKDKEIDRLREKEKDLKIQELNREISYIESSMSKMATHNTINSDNTTESIDNYFSAINPITSTLDNTKSIINKTEKELIEMREKERDIKIVELERQIDFIKNNSKPPYTVINNKDNVKTKTIKDYENGSISNNINTKTIKDNDYNNKDDDLKSKEQSIIRNNNNKRNKYKIKESNNNIIMKLIKRQTKPKYGNNVKTMTVNKTNANLKEDDDYIDKEIKKDDDCEDKEIKEDNDCEDKEEEKCKSKPYLTNAEIRLHNVDTNKDIKIKLPIKEITDALNNKNKKKK